MDTPFIHASKSNYTAFDLSKNKEHDSLTAIMWSTCKSGGPWFEPNPWSWSISFSAARNWIASWRWHQELSRLECQNNAASFARLSLN